MARKELSQDEPTFTPTVEATERAIEAATHLTPMDDGAVAALRALARKIDEDNVLRMAYIQWYRETTGKVPEKPLQMDNVSIPTYLKYCESLGLTPAGRTRAQIEGGKGDGGTSTLGKLRLAHGKGA